MNETKNVNEVRSEIKANLKGIFKGNLTPLYKVVDKIGGEIEDFTSMEDYKRRLVMAIIKEISLMVKNGELNHHSFDTDFITDDLWTPLKKMVYLKRIEEFKGCKITRKGKSFNISDLKTSYFGRFILFNLGFASRSVINPDEYKMLKKQVTKMNLELPVEINPTDTEKFFEKKQEEARRL